MRTQTNRIRALAPRILASSASLSSFPISSFPRIRHFTSGSPQPQPLGQRLKRLAKLFGKATLACTGISAASLFAANTYFASHAVQPAVVPVPLTGELKDQLTQHKSWSEFIEKTNIVLYQYQTCPFCNKVRAFLDFAGVPYSVVEVEPLFKQELKFSPYKMVPVVAIDGIQINDSDVIIRELTNFMRQLPGNPLSARLSAPADTADWLARVGGERGLLRLTVINLYRNGEETKKAFEYIDEQSNIPALLRPCVKVLGGAAMSQLARRRAKQLDIKEPRQAIYEWIGMWMTEGVGAKKFRGGNAPDLSDLATFGVCRALMGFPVGGDIINPNNTSKEFVEWYKRMSSAVGESKAKNGGHNTKAANFKVDFS